MGLSSVILDRLCVVSMRTIRRLRIKVSSDGVFLYIPPEVSRDRAFAFVEKNSEWILKNISLLNARHEVYVTRSILNNFMERINGIIERCESLAGIYGVGFRFRWMKSRWGSCVPARKRVTLNLALAAFDDSVVEYVVIHELCHMLFPNHSKEFWGAVEMYCPDYKKQRGVLKNSPLPVYRPDIE